jgi:hypothetical protein
VVRVTTPPTDPAAAHYAEVHRRRIATTRRRATDRLTLALLAAALDARSLLVERLTRPDGPHTPRAALDAARDLVDQLTALLDDPHPEVVLVRGDQAGDPTGQPEAGPC